MAETTLSAPQVKIIPPLIYLAGLVAGILLSLWLPTKWLPEWLAASLGVLLVLTGAGFTAPAVVNFRRSGTPIRPWETPTALVLDGPYKITRNPMYLGLALVYLGIAIAAQSLWAIIFLPVVLVIIQRAAIEKEEAFLAQRFGADYERYRKSVRRWL